MKRIKHVLKVFIVYSVTQPMTLDQKFLMEELRRPLCNYKEKYNVDLAQINRLQTIPNLSDINKYFSTQNSKSSSGILTVLIENRKKEDSLPFIISCVQSINSNKTCDLSTRKNIIVHSWNVLLDLWKKSFMHRRLMPDEEATLVNELLYNDIAPNTFLLTTINHACNSFCDTALEPLKVIVDHYAKKNILNALQDTFNNTERPVIPYVLNIIEGIISHPPSNTKQLMFSNAIKTYQLLQIYGALPSKENIVHNIIKNLCAMSCSSCFSIYFLRLYAIYDKESNEFTQLFSEKNEYNYTPLEYAKNICNTTNIPNRKICAEYIIQLLEAMGKKQPIQETTKIDDMYSFINKY